MSPENSGCVYMTLAEACGYGHNEWFQKEVRLEIAMA